MLTSRSRSKGSRESRSLIRDALAAMAVDDLSAATSRLAEAQAQTPGAPDLAHALALVALRLGEPGKALELLRQAHREAPTAREHADALAIIHAKLGQLHDSLYFAKLAVALDPAYPKLALNPAWLGEYSANFATMVERPLLAEAESMMRAGDPAAAAELYRKDIEINRNSAPSWRGFAAALRRSGRPYDALVAYGALRALVRQTGDDLSALAATLADCGQHEHALACHERAVRLEPENRDRLSALLSDMARNSLVRRGELAARQRDWGAVAPPPVGEPAAASAVHGRSLRVGFLSGRFLEHGGLAPLLSLFAAPRRPLWEAHCYSNVASEDGLTRRLQNIADGWRDVSALDDDTAALIMRNDCLDVLIDLDGHRDTGRPAIVQLRPASRCLSLFGLPEAAEGQGFDGVLGDAWIYPESAEAAANIVRIPNGLFRMPQEVAPAAAARSREDGTVVFGSRAPRSAISGGVVAVWADVLAAVPESILVLDSTRLGGTAGLAEIETQFGWYGFENRISVASGHGEWSSLVDIVLDAGLGGDLDDALDALGQGKPIATLLGDRPDARIVASLLSSLGFADCVAAGPAEYVAIAARLASDPKALGATARRIVDRIQDNQGRLMRDGAADFGQAIGRWLNATLNA